MRIDDLTGKNRVTYTPSGPSGSFVYVDKAGHIYYRNDEGALNRMDDMSGANLVLYGSVGNGTAQFLRPTGIAVK